MAKDTQTLMEPLFAFANRTPFNIAPERGKALAEEVFGTKGWELTATKGKANFYALPEEAKVGATYAGLASLWCLSFVAFHLADIASRQQRDGDRTVQCFDIGEECTLLQLDEYLCYARSLFRGDREWPKSLRQPDVNAAFDSDAGRVNNVFYGALAWVLLHEIGHVYLDHEESIPVEQRLRQEFAADGFATRWVLCDAGQEMQREFRVLMVCVGLAWLFLNEETIGKGRQHPAAILRFQEAAALFELDDTSVALENATYIFKAIFDPETELQAFDSPKEAFEQITSRLEELFPR